MDLKIVVTGFLVAIACSLVYSQDEPETTTAATVITTAGNLTTNTPEATTQPGSGTTSGPAVTTTASHRSSGCTIRGLPVIAQLSLTYVFSCVLRKLMFA